MRIAFLLPGGFAIVQPAHGVLAQARFQAAALERAGHEVLRLNPWEPCDLRSVDVLHFYNGGLQQYSVETAIKGKRPLLAFSPVIDSNESNRRYRIAARVGGIHPRLFTVPGILKRQGRFAQLVTVRSSYERDRLVRGLEIEPCKVRIVLNGVDPPQSFDANRARHELDLPDEFALHISEFTSARKNVGRLIEAVGPLGYPLVIGGHAEPSSELEHLQRLANKYGNVRFVGFLDAKLRDSLYCACKVFCLPSIHEGTGLVALEAAARGATVVVTKNGGPADYFLDLAEYVDPYSVEDIRNAVERAWKLPRTEKLREHVVAKLTWDQSATSLVQAYSEQLQASE